MQTTTRRVAWPVLLRLVALIAVLVAGITIAVQSGRAPSAAAAATPVSGTLHVSGNALLDSATGQPIVLHGVNRSGTEYACIQGWGIEDGPMDAPSVQAIASWGATIVRVPLNEDCWLGINGVTSQYGGASYRSAIVAYVNLLHQYGMRAELSLIWGAPGSYPATYQPDAPDADHSPAFWSSLAATFKGDQQDILAPWGETTVGWSCFLNGCSNEATYGPQNAHYQTAGMQQAVTVMRQAGYVGVIAIPCIDYANICGSNGGTWLQYEPTDPLRNLIAEAHVYGFNICATPTCLQQQVAPVAAAVPVIFGELGTGLKNCGSSDVQAIVGWADAHQVSWEAWTWDTWNQCLALISNYNGTVRTGEGATYPSYIHSQLLSYGTGGGTGGGGTATPTATSSGGTATPTATSGVGTATPTATSGGGQQTPTPTATSGGDHPTPTPTPTSGGDHPTPTPTPTSSGGQQTPTPTPNPVPGMPIQAVPCVVEIGGVMRLGTCTGTFQISESVARS